MFNKRSSGILLHPTAFPSPYGIGDLGNSAYNFLDFLEESGQSIWQILPLVPPSGFTNSPYSALSAFGGNPLLISPDMLIKDGLLKREDIKEKKFSSKKVIFDKIIPFKYSLLEKAFSNFKNLKESTFQCRYYKKFLAANSFWLDDLALFLSLKKYFDRKSWNLWDKDIAGRNKKALIRYREKLSDDIEREKFYQFIFDRQWHELKAHAFSKGIKIIGDIPIFIDYDSADVWANRELFRIDKDFRPEVVTGVPPDYFSETGQLWGHPHYNWKNHKKTGYDWWLKRFEYALSTVDIVRIDHFRGFDESWVVNYGETTAINGKWEKYPGREFLTSLKAKLGFLPVIGEDLGVITDDVRLLLNDFDIPGMRVLQFGVDPSPDNIYNPYNFPPKSIVYSGTHDNDTTVGWFKKLSAERKKEVKAYTGTDGKNIHLDIIRLAMNSPSVFSIFPLQDILGLGTGSRFNTPGTVGSNWNWRYESSMLNRPLSVKLKNLTRIYGRLPYEL